jgi:hypothetical protein
MTQNLFLGASASLFGKAKKDFSYEKTSSELLGLTTKMSGVGTNCYPTGNCTNETMVKNYTLYDKTYTIEDSIILRALSVYGSKMIEGGYITVINNVKDKQPLYRDEIRVKYQSTANGGKAGNQCGPFDPHGGIDLVTNKCIHTYFLYVEAAVCYKQLVGSFQQRLLNQGQLFSEENDALNDRVLDEIIASNNRQTDRLIWKGDYKSPVDDICHYDGLIKKIFNEIGNASNHTMQYKFSGTLGATECFEIQYGGQFETFNFDTDTATTIGNLVTWLTDLKHPTSLEPLLTVQFNGTDELTLVSNDRWIRIEMEIQSTDCDGFDCTASGSVSIDAEELVAFEVSDAPLTIPFVPITPTNVIQQLGAIFMKAAGEHPDLSTHDDFYAHVDPKVYAALKVATMNLTGAAMGVNGMQESPNPYGLRVVEQPGMVNTNAIIATRTSNIFFGTDLESDMDNTQVWVDRDCQEVRMRHESRQGVQVDRFYDVVCNLECANYNFQPAQPEDCQAVSNC